LIARCIWLASVARSAPSDSGARISAATRKPTSAAGAPSTRTPKSSGTAIFFDSSTIGTM